MMIPIETKRLLVFGALLVVCLAASAVCGQRDNDNDDFDDSGFDDSGYNSPQSHDAEGSNQNPSSYAAADADDLDDDDDVDESANVAKVAGPQQFYSPANSIVLPLAKSRQR